MGALEDESPVEEQWIALKVCQIISAVLPCAAEKRGLMDHRQVQRDLQALIKNQPSTGVHEAVKCLCLVVKYVTGDLSQLVRHLNISIPALTHLCNLAEEKPGSLDRIQQMFISRQVWILSTLLETLSVDDYIDNSPADEHGTGHPRNKRRRILRASLRFDFVDGSVVSTAADLLVRLYALGDSQSQAVVVTCLGFFLCRQRAFVKDRRISNIFADALASDDACLRLKMLETLSSLLSHFGCEADQETRRLGVAGSAASVDDPGMGSAVEYAQPLATYSDAVLGHITICNGATFSKASGGTCADGEVALKTQVEALSVVRHLHQQGLLNPMIVLPKVFALSFSSLSALAEPASSMLQEMLELRPTLLLNRMDEAFREAFLATLSGPHPPHLGGAMSITSLTALTEVYAERFRKQKGMREAFIRKILRELFRLNTERFLEWFPEPSKDLCKVINVPTLSRSKRAQCESTSPTKPVGPEGGQSAAFKKLQPSQRFQLLYAQFLASAVSVLPFIYESEPLIVVFECNRHLSLHAGSLFTSLDHDDVEVVENAPDAFVACDGAKSNDMFSDALSIVTCQVLKTSMKEAHGLSAEQCAQFNPKEVRQERLKNNAPSTARGGLVGGSGGAVSGGNMAEEAVPSLRIRFPANQWSAHVAQLAAHSRSPLELAGIVRNLTDNDPWDSTSSRHAAVLTRLEGRGSRRGHSAKQKMVVEELGKNDDDCTPPDAKAPVPPAHNELRRPPKRRRHLTEEVLPVPEEVEQVSEDEEVQPVIDEVEIVDD